MNPLERAIAICGTQTELARRVTGKPATGHVYHWRRHGVSEEIAIAIEVAVAAVIAESPEAAGRAVELGGAVTAEDLRPDREWERDTETGAITGYRVPVPPRTAAAEGDAADVNSTEQKVA